MFDPNKRYDDMTPLEQVVYHVLKGSIDPTKPVSVCVAVSNADDMGKQYYHEEIYSEGLNDFVIRADGSVELWHNKGYEI